MVDFIAMAIGLAIFLAGFIFGTFIEGIRSNLLVMRMEQQVQQQHIDQQIQSVVTNTSIPEYNEDTKQMPEYYDG